MSGKEPAGGTFDGAVRVHSRELFRYAFWLCRDRGRAEDLVQETFIRAWNAWGDLREPAALKGWLYTILRNEHLRGFERKQLDYDDRDLEDIDIPVDVRTDVAIDVKNALFALPASLREPFLMQVLGGFTCEEIASALSTTEGAVMTRLTRARQALRKLLDRGTPLQEGVR